MVFIRKHGQKLFALLPAGISWAAAAYDAPIFLIVALLSMLLIAEAIPLFRGREVIGVFLMAAPVLVPWDIRITAWFNEILVFAMEGIFLSSFRILMGFMLFSIEEILLCWLARIIWPDQEEIKL